MASPTNAASPTAMSPPYPSPAQIPSKKRSSSFEANGKPPALKRRKASTLSQASGAGGGGGGGGGGGSAAQHPLRQTSFPPEAAGSPHTRSPSMDAVSHVSGSAVSGVGSSVAAAAAARRKRGRKSRAGGGGGGGGKGDDGGNDQASSVAGGKAGTAASGQGGDKEAEDDEDEDKAEMALEDVVARTQEQKQEEIRLRAMLVEAFDSEQYNRYELWRAAKLSDAVVKRVVNATVSQSVPQMVSTAVKAVAKLFAGEIIEQAREVQAEWIRAGEHQSELPLPAAAAAAAADEDGVAATDINGSGGDDGNRSSHDDDGGGGGGGDDDDDKTTTNNGNTSNGNGNGKRSKTKSIEEMDPKRGPLRPDHLRAAWLRYRASKQSHGVGMQQLWHHQQGSGVERFSARTRKQLFR
ncbi:transcription initiation factor tfiid subunit 11 [Cordyceps javanica]|uniref:Transcription initiation factor tfiid subunit 11 n=1 Tax=Cordyceps javanica TaxID=43265 RepID=A0A545UMC8_9HYPO|nr:transcription initiation factor tfiid subunit 11 [Cordyceps javanica]TQW02063.1 transcription initiation factor tfiid subunit 11 [Cordyceps javanica]